VNRLCLIAAAAALLSGSAAADARAHRATHLQCGIAWAYIEDLLAQHPGERSVFSFAPVTPFIPEDYPRHWSESRGLNEVPPPAAGLVETVPLRTNAVRDCSSNRQALKRLGVRFGRAAVASATRPGRARSFHGWVRAVSLPTVSADGAHAILVVINSGGGTDAGEQWIHMERGQDGRWRISGTAALFVS
jgi:hypothetical protein